MKEKERLKKTRDFLFEHGKATWTDISKETGIQSKELASDLKKLLKNEISVEQDSKDRRKTWYMLRDKDRTHAESKRYEVVENIENLKEPLFVEVEAEKDGFKVLASYFFEGPIISIARKSFDLDRDIKRPMQEALEQVTKQAVEIMRTQDILEPPVFTKFVTVWAYEAPQEKVNENIARFLKQLAKKEDVKRTNEPLKSPNDPKTVSK